MSVVVSFKTTANQTMCHSYTGTRGTVCGIKPRKKTVSFHDTRAKRVGHPARRRHKAHTNDRTHLSESAFLARTALPELEPSRDLARFCSFGFLQQHHNAIVTSKHAAQRIHAHCATDMVFLDYVCIKRANHASSTALTRRYFAAEPFSVVSAAGRVS